MKKSFVKELFIQYWITFLGMFIGNFAHISILYFTWYNGDFSYIDEFIITSIFLLPISLWIFIMQDVIFRAIWKVKIKNIELFILVVLFMGIFLVSDFSFMGDFLQILSNFLLSPVLFWIYLIYLKYLKN